MGKIGGRVREEIIEYDKEKGKIIRILELRETGERSLKD